jgi:hypothetical protein
VVAVPRKTPQTGHKFQNPARHMRSHIVLLSAYKKVRVIGSGSFGKSYLTHDRETQSYYVVKTISNESMDLDRLFPELEQIVSVRHPAVVPFVSYSPPNPAKRKPLAVATPYYASGSLATVIASKQPIPNLYRLKILFGVAEAVRYLHELGRPHRYLTPTNILINHRFEPHVCDIGLLSCRMPTLPSFVQRYNTPENAIAFDVFCYGTLIYSIFTETFFGDAELPELDPAIPMAFRDLILACWSPALASRPTFEYIVMRFMNKGFRLPLEAAEKREFREYRSRIVAPAVVNCRLIATLSRLATVTATTARLADAVSQLEEYIGFMSNQNSAHRPHRLQFELPELPPSPTPESDLSVEPAPLSPRWATPALELPPEPLSPRPQPAEPEFPVPETEPDPSPLESDLLITHARLAEINLALDGVMGEPPKRPFGSGAKIVSIPSFVAREIVSGERGPLEKAVGEAPYSDRRSTPRRWSDGSDDEVVHAPLKTPHVVNVDLPTNTEFQYTENAFDGIFAYLIDQAGVNLTEHALVQIKGNSLDRGNDQDLPHVVNARWRKCWRSRNEALSYVEFTFLICVFFVTDYTIRTYLSPAGGPHLRSWKLTGKCPPGPWFEIDVRDKVEDLGGRTEFRTYHCQKPGFARVLRITQTGPNSSGNNSLVIATVEFFGKVG